MSEERSAEDKLKMAFWFIKKCDSIEEAIELIKVAGEGLKKFTKRQEEIKKLQCNAKDCRDEADPNKDCKCGWSKLCARHDKCRMCSGKEKQPEKYPVYVHKMHFESVEGNPICAKLKSAKLTTDLNKVTCMNCLEKMGVKQT